MKSPRSGCGLVSTAARLLLSVSLRMIRGIIFDLDGTLMDSRLDFDQMRRELHLPEGEPILEAMERMSDSEVTRCQEVLRRHELDGARRAVPLPGVLAVLDWVRQHELRAAIMTRNSRPMTQLMLEQLPFPFYPVLTRDDGPVKPDPWGVQHTCELWQLSPEQVLVVGDYRYDIEAGRRAGCRTVALVGSRNAAAAEWARQADLVLDSLADSDQLFGWLGRYRGSDGN